MIFPRNSRPFPRGYGFQTHQSHQSLDPLSIYLISFSYKEISHLAGPVKRMACIFFINKAHQFQVLLGFRFRFPVVAGSRQSDQITLPSNAQLLMVRLYHPKLCSTRPAGTIVTRFSVIVTRFVSWSLFLGSQGVKIANQSFRFA